MIDIVPGSFMDKYVVHEDMERFAKQKRLTFHLFTDGSYIKKLARYGVAMLLPVLRGEYTQEQLNRFDTLFPRSWYILPIDMPDEFTKSQNIVSEILAVMVGVTLILNFNPKVNIMVHHDYTGLANWLTGAFEANTPITKIYRAWFLSNRLYNIVDFTHVRAHASDPYNNTVDYYTRTSRDGMASVSIVKYDDVVNILLFKDKCGSEVRCGFISELAR